MSDSPLFPALVLAAGLGTRLHPLTLVRAKPAVPVAGEVLIRRLLYQLAAAGVSQVVINLHHRPETITGRVGDGSDLGLQVRYSWEQPVLGSAGGPRRALPLLDAERFFVLNGDTLSDVDLPALARAHVDSGALVTMAVGGGEVARYGGVIVNEDGTVGGFARARRAVEGERLEHFVGVQAVDARAFAALSPDQPSETVRGLYPELLARDPRAIRAFVSPTGFLDIGTPADYVATVRTLATREGRPLDRGEHVTVADSATVDGTIIWDRVTVGRDASLVDCIVTDGVTVPAGARYERAVLVTIDGALQAFSL